MSNLAKAVKILGFTELPPLSPENSLKSSMLRSRYSTPKVCRIAGPTERVWRLSQCVVTASLAKKLVAYARCWKRLLFTTKWTWFHALATGIWRLLISSMNFAQQLAVLIQREADLKQHLRTGRHTYVGLLYWSNVIHTAWTWLWNLVALVSISVPLLTWIMFPRYSLIIYKLRKQTISLSCLTVKMRCKVLRTSTR